MVLSVVELEDDDDHESERDASGDDDIDADAGGDGGVASQQGRGRGRREDDQNVRDQKAASSLFEDIEVYVLWSSLIDTRKRLTKSTQTAFRESLPGIVTANGRYSTMYGLEGGIDTRRRFTTSQARVAQTNGCHRGEERRKHRKMFYKEVQSRC